MSVLDRIELLPSPLSAVGMRGGASRIGAGRNVYRVVALTVDVVCALAIFAALGRSESSSALLVAAVGAATFTMAIATAGGYDTRFAAVGYREYRAIGRGAAAVMLLAMLLVFLQVVTMSPLLLTLAVVGVTMCGVSLRFVQRQVARTLRHRGWLASRTLLVGDGAAVERAEQELRVAHPGLMFVGACLADSSPASLSGDLQVLGGTADVADVSKGTNADIVIVTAGAMAADELRSTQWELERQGTELAILPGVSEVLDSRIDLQVVGATAMLELKLTPSPWQRMAKAVMDRVLGSALLIVLAPVIAIAALVVRLDSDGPSLFRQIRIGRDGRPFTMYKLRTMTADAEERRCELADADTGAGPLFKVEDDPRITSVGRALRRFSIDELPQLWNVVRGDMSLVGPRPPLASEVASYDALSVHRLHVKPGLTGLWQVSGRSDLSWEESVRLDLRYVDNWSIGFDLQILCRTARAVLGARGAY
ncbi:MAG: sugar transferase [Beutenbergiaceae bacterium]